MDETLQHWRDLYEVTNQALRITQDSLVRANDECISLQEQIRMLKQEVVNEEKPKDNGFDPLTSESIAQYAAAGAVVVWRSWRNNMLKQFRQVPAERMRWDTLPEQDKDLDRRICEDVVTDFANWLIRQLP